MRLALIADTFPPLRSSGAVQLRDLSREFARQGHELTVILPEHNLREAWNLSAAEGFQVLRLRAPRTKDVSHLRRALAELMMPFAMLNNFMKSPLVNQQWDGVIWYSPSIFHGPLVKSIKRSSNCKSYLIIRDIFPEWAADMGLMNRGATFCLFKSIARYQYSVADIIAVQTAGNLTYFGDWQKKQGRTLDILPNWLGEPGTTRCHIRIENTMLAGRKVFVYAGNMGIAQNMDIVIDLADHLHSRKDVGFLLVGRGSEVDRLKAAVEQRNLENILFFDEIDSDEIPDLYSQCHVGIVSLDPRHKSHNIPGKFLTYMQSGLPILANVNTGNDLVALVSNWSVGEVSENGEVGALTEQAERLISMDTDFPEISRRCKTLFMEHFSVTEIAKSIVNRLDNEALAEAATSEPRSSIP